MGTKIRPRWSDLPPEFQARFGNGVGPSWFPAFLRNFTTKHYSWFFREASWKHHDFGYWVGHAHDNRKEYDDKFLAAMKRDLQGRGFLTKMSGFVISRSFYAAVRVGGGGSFYYHHEYRCIEELQTALEEAGQ